MTKSLPLGLWPTALIFACTPVLAANDEVRNAAPLASVSMITESAGVVDIPVTIAGRTKNFRVNSSGNMTMLSESAATELAIPRNHVPYHKFVLYGGARLTQYAVADSLRLANYDAPGAKFLIVPDTSIPLGIAGQLGLDYLRDFDLEFDFPAGKLNVYSTNKCSEAAPSGSSELPIQTDHYERLTADVQLDGKTITAVIDTGIPVSLVNFSAMQDMFGMSAKTPGLKSLASRNGYSYLLIYPFKTLVLQGMTLKDPDIEIEVDAIQVHGISALTHMRPELMLGASVLRRLHFCVSYDAEKLYLIPTAQH